MPILSKKSPAPATSLDDLLPQAAADPELLAARDCVRTLAARRVELADRLEALTRELNVPPDQGGRLPGRIRLDRDAVSIELGDLDHELAQARAQALGEATRVWSALAPQLRELRLEAARALNEALTVASERNREVYELEQRLHEARPAEVPSSPYSSLCCAGLSRTRLDEWRRFLSQEGFDID